MARGSIVKKSGDLERSSLVGGPNDHDSADAGQQHVLSPARPGRDRMGPGDRMGQGRSPPDGHPFVAHGMHPEPMGTGHNTM